MMLRFSRFAGAVLTAFAMMSPAMAGLDNPGMAPNAYAQAVANGDADALAALYKDDARAFAPDGSMLEGRAAIKAANARNFAAGSSQIEFTDVQYDFGDTKGVMLWTWTLTISPTGGAPIMVKGRSLVGWAKGAEGWEITADMFQVLP